MKPITFIINPLYPQELESIKRELRFYKMGNLVKITYRFKRAYIHLTEDKRYCSLLNLLLYYYHIGLYTKPKRNYLITSKKGYEFLSNYFKEDIHKIQL